VRSGGIFGAGWLTKCPTTTTIDANRIFDAMVYIDYIGYKKSRQLCLLWNEDTLLDGEVISYSCMPKMCRVHKHYIRLLKRDEKGAIIYERHINEAAIQQIEYS